MYSQGLTGDVDIDTGTATYKAGIVTAGTFQSNIVAYTNNNIGRQAATQLCFVQQGKMCIAM